MMGMENLIDACGYTIGFWTDEHVDKREFFIAVQKTIAKGGFSIWPDGFDPGTLSMEMAAHKFMQFDEEGSTGADIMFLNWSAEPKDGFDPCTVISWFPAPTEKDG